MINVYSAVLCYAMLCLAVINNDARTHRSHILTSGIIDYFLDDGHHLVGQVRVIVHQISAIQCSHVMLCYAMLCYVMLCHLT
jgi:hypothetical protein